MSADQLISAVETGSITGVNMTKELIEALKSFKCEHCVCFGIFVLLDLRAVFETRRHKTVLFTLYFCCVVYLLSKTTFEGSNNFGEEKSDDERVSVVVCFSVSFWKPQ